MNSRERRTLNRYMERNGIVKKTIPPQDSPAIQTGSQSPPQSKSERWHGWLDRRREDGFDVASAVGILGGIALWPDVAVEPYVSRDSQNAFSEQFSVQNTNYYGLRNIRPSCSVVDAQIKGSTIIQDNLVFNRTEFVSNLPRSAKINVTCRFTNQRLNFEPVKLQIVVDYYAPLSFHRCKAVNFTASMQATECTFGCMAVVHPVMTKSVK